MSETRRIEDQLRRAFEGEAWHGPTPAYRLMHGAIQHDLYHAGQIAALRKGAGA